MKDMFTRPGTVRKSEYRDPKDPKEKYWCSRISTLWSPMALTHVLILGPYPATSSFNFNQSPEDDLQSIFSTWKSCGEVTQKAGWLWKRYGSRRRLTMNHHYCCHTAQILHLSALRLHRRHLDDVNDLSNLTFLMDGTWNGVLLSLIRRNSRFLDLLNCRLSRKPSEFGPLRTSTTTPLPTSPACATCLVRQQS